MIYPPILTKPSVADSISHVDTNTPQVPVSANERLHERQATPCRRAVGWFG